MKEFGFVVLLLAMAFVFCVGGYVGSVRVERAMSAECYTQYQINARGAR